MAARTGGNGRQGEAAGDGGGPELHHQADFGRGLLGLAAASAAITLAVTEPPPWLHRNAYFVALSGVFFAGMAQVVAAGGRDHVAGRKNLMLMHALLVVPLAVAAVL